MKKLGCAKCGKVVKSLPKAQKGTVKKSGKYPLGDRGDNSENYTAGGKDKWGRPTTSKWYGFNPETKKYQFKKAGGSTSRLETMIPTGVTGPNMSPRVMRDGGPFSPEARAARKDKRAEKKAAIKGTLQSLKPRSKQERALNKATKAYKQSIKEEFQFGGPVFGKLQEKKKIDAAKKRKKKK